MSVLLRLAGLDWEAWGETTPHRPRGLGATFGTDCSAGSAASAAALWTSSAPTQHVALILFAIFRVEQAKDVLNVLEVCRMIA